MVWFLLLIPLIIGIVLLFIFKKEDYQERVFLPTGISFGVTLFFISILSFGYEYSATKSTEYLTDLCERVEYDEPWNEYVHRTCTRSCCCDSKGQNCSTETYDCSYVDYHPARYTLYTVHGESFGISEEYYVFLKNKFGNSNFVELNRDYYTIDGDRYVSYWDKSYEKHEVINWTGTYENRIKASHSIFHFRDLKPQQIKSYSLKDYPYVINLHQNAVSGSFKRSLNNIEGVKKINYLNGFLGHEKQVKMFVMIYNNNDQMTGEYQKDYLKGGNKNEINICIGTDSLTGKVNWAYVFSWSRSEKLKIEIRDFLESQKELDLLALANYLEVKVPEEFIRRQFKEFKYIKIDMPGWIFITIIIFSIVSFFVSFYVIQNNSNNNIFRKNKYRW